MPCAETESRLHAYLDGELDALAAAAFEGHLESCAECRAALEGLEAMRAALRAELPYERAPAALAARVTAALDREASAAAPPAQQPEDELMGDPLAALTALTTLAAQRRDSRDGRPASARWARGRGASARGASGRGAPSFGRGLLTGAGGGLLAAVLAFFLISPHVISPRSALLDDLVNAHVRSLLPAHLVDVESTDRHTVKPWFAGHVDVSPAVYDFAEQGYRLVGGRADYFEHQRAAALVYQHGPHVINVFSWAGEGALPADTTRNGYHLAFWQEGNLRYCAVSDTGWTELLKLVGLIRAAAGQESHG
jgi:anti-sigma factor RsiW